MEKIKDFLLKVWIILSVITLISVTSLIIVYIFKSGISSISMDFIFKEPKGFPIGSEGGIFPAITGSLMLMIISSLIASILALSTSIYLVYYSKSNRLENIVHLVIQCIAGIPSIVLGLFGYALLVVYMNLGRSLISGAITLGIMIFPYMQIRIEKILRELDENLIKSSYSLGVSKYYMIFKLIVPNCRANIISAITLGGSLAIGATAPIILTSAVITAPTPSSLNSPVMALPFHLYILTGEGISLDKSYATALILIAIIFFINIISSVLSIKGSEK